MPDDAGAAAREAGGPEGAAVALLREFEARFTVDEVPPVPVERIAESHLGLLIEEIDDVRSLPNAPTDQGPLSGMLDAEAQTIWLDRAEARRSRGRRRFTIAHECGHWVLHVGANGLLICREQDVGAGAGGVAQSVKPLRQREAEANAFAQALLMPELLVHEHAERTGCNLAALAERFDVSVPAIRLRLLTLGLLPAWMASVPIVEREGEKR
ncbi:MAG: ImmA/IrrE family metallo-endopeptidase [Solirubrobacteraceae bacterium]